MVLKDLLKDLHCLAVSFFSHQSYWHIHPPVHFLCRLFKLKKRYRDVFETVVIVLPRMLR